VSATLYTTTDLQEVDERCQGVAAELGFDVPPVVYHLMRSSEIYDIAARGLPGRYSSSRFGAIFSQQHGDYRMGRSRIYELIVNTDPVHAYLLEGNSLVAQTLVIAHCTGHAWFFANNRWFEPTDRLILPRVRSAADRIGSYMAEHGRDRVEDFIDACEAIAIHQPQAQMVRRAQPSARGAGERRAARAVPRRARGRPAGLHRAPRATARGLAARRDLDRALRAVLLPAAAAHADRQ
jgi:spore cortex formation protein SpoVR/YcgB (stage V sporulation)